MFYRLLLVEALFATVYSSCTPFIACNQTVYGDLNDFENGKKVVLLGRPFQKNDELIITGELFNNGSDIEDDATFTVGFAKGLIMQQLDGYPENYLLTVTVGVGESPMLVTGYVAGNLRNEYGMKKLSSPNINPTSTEFTFKIR
uniref:Galectin n=1 Tax=Caenorhabditis japonica TaxID=281687 RepID=A0A8R1HHX2_CAEJA